MEEIPQDKTVFEEHVAGGRVVLDDVGGQGEGLQLVEGKKSDIMGSSSLR